MSAGTKWSVGRSEKCARLGEVGSPVAATLLDLDTSLQDMVGAPQVSCAKEDGGDAAAVDDSSELAASPVLKRKWDRNRRRRDRRVIRSTQSSSASDSVNSGAGRQRGDAVSASSTPLSQPPDGGSQKMSPVSFTFDPSPLCASAGLQSPRGTPGGFGDVSLLLAESVRVATPLSGSGAASLSQMRRRALLERLSNTDGGSSPGNHLRQPEIPPSAVGPFHGLPSCVPALLKKQRGIDQLYAWQEECLALEAVRLRRNLVYSLPTSGGKTLVAELLIMKELVCRQRDCVFVLPYVAIVQEKVRSLAPFGIALGFIVAEYASSKGSFPPPKRKKRRTVYVCTIEKAAGLVASLLELGRVDELGLAVVDEVHMLGDGSRGATLELLTLLLKHAAPNVQLVGMSATVGNMSDVCAFLEATSYNRPFRPVELREHVLLAGQLLEVTGTAADPPDQLLTPRRQVNFPQYTVAQKRADPDCLGGLVAEVIPANSCLVFCPTRKNCEAVAKLICQVLSRELKEHLLDKKHALFRALLKESSGEVCPVLASTLPYGVAYHHSGLTTDERKLLEEAYLEGTLSCLCCTSTLAAGVNLPAKRVILRSPYTGSAFLTRSRYKQMAGRAGRAGIDDSGESILIVQTSDAKRVGALLTSPVEHCFSGLHDRDRHGLRRLVISAVALGLADSPQLVHQLASRSLLAVQAETLQISLDDVLSEVVEELHKERLLRICRKDTVVEAEEDETGAIVMSAADRLQSDVKLKVSRLGAAAVKGNVDLGVASRLYEDLRRAQPALAVINQLHLLYLVTPYDMMDDITPVAGVYLDLFSSLDAEELAVAHLIGVSEHRLVKMMSGVAPTGAVHRFYLTLMLHSVLGSGSLWRTAEQFQVHRGLLQQLTAAAAGFAAGVLHFCRQLDELWPYAQLLEAFNRRLAVGYSQELLELLELPAVKQGRARALFAAGYSNLQTLANADPSELVAKLDHLPRRVARQIVDSAKMLVLERAEALQEEAEFMLDGLKTIEFHESPGLGELILTGINDEESARVKNSPQDPT